MTNRNYVLCSPDARLYQAIHVARHDIEIARDMIELALTDESWPRDVEEAGWTAAAIRYARALKGDNSLARVWQTALSTLSSEEFEVHLHVLTIRDTMYAHPVGIGTDMTPTAHVGTASDGKLTLWGVGIQSARISSPGTDTAGIFARILDKLGNFMEEQEAIQQRTVLENLRLQPESAWIAGGEYSKNLHFDNKSARYKKEKEKRSERK